MGPITGLTLNASGIGYTPDTTVTISDVYSTGTGATATATIVLGVITGLSLTNAGTNYSAPLVTIAGSGGTGAAAIATIGGAALSLSGGIRKFMDSLPGLNPAGQSTRLQYIPIAVADQATYLGYDYYEIELGEYSQAFHQDLPPTKLRGYRQTNGS